MGSYPQGEELPMISGTFLVLDSGSCNFLCFLPLVLAYISLEIQLNVPCFP